MKILILGDTHLGARNDSEFFMDFFFEFFDNVVFPYIEQNNITDVIQTGDLMDKRKGVNYRTLNKISSDFMGKLRKLGCTLHIIPGNHDIYYRNSNDVNSMTELFSWMPHVKIYNEPTSVPFDGCYIDFIPWMNKNNSEQSIDFIHKSIAQVCVGHFEISGFEMYPGIAGHGGLVSDLFQDYELTISGHYHHKSAQKNITYVGTPYEMTWADYNDPKGFHILDTENRSLTFFENPYRMFIKAFYSSDIDYNDYDFSCLAGTIVKVIVQDKTDNGKYEWFLSKINDQNPVNMSVVDSDVTVLHGVDEEQLETLDTFVVLTQSAKATAENEGLDPNIMNELIQNLYSEAITLGREN